ncbi:MAG: TRAP transporter small permease [Chloroflexota bacterium]
MWLKRAARYVTTLINSVSRSANIVAMAVLVAMMLLTVADVTMRYVFRKPLLGSMELSEYMMIVVVFLALPWCAAQGRQVKVDLVVARFKPRARAIVDSLTILFSLVVGVILTWRNLAESLVLLQLHKVSSLLDIPTYIFYLIMSAGFAILCLVIVTLLVKNIAKVFEA